jgi:hypothetical protein
MKELTEAEKQVTEEAREVLVSLDEKQIKLAEHQTNIRTIPSYHLEVKNILRYFSLGVYLLLQFQLYIFN